jgi:hypothetical protein
MNESVVRAYRAAKQGLDGSLAGAKPADVLARTGWARSVGGVGPYLSLFARAGTPRVDADAAVKKLAIHELPAARGCTYVVPATHFGLALAVGAGFADAEMATARKLGVTEREIDALCTAVLDALDEETLDPDGLRAATGKASRSLGDEGKRKGLTTTLPVALGRLQAEGEIRRVPLNGRLDQQRYAYTRFRPNPLAKRKKGADEFAELARLFFEWVGPARVSEFRWFAGLGVKAAKDALASVELVPIADGDDRVIFARELDALRAFKAPKEPAFALVSSLDAIAAHRRTLGDLVSQEDTGRKVFAGGNGLTDLASHAILLHGRIVGLWEYDPEREKIVWASFVGKSRALEAAVARTEAFVRDELGDARSFSLDSPKSRAPRIQAIAKMK